MPDEPLYWLLTGDTPTGPFTAAQIHQQLVAGTVTWQARACQVGGTTWFPLIALPGFGPTAPISTNSQPVEQVVPVPVNQEVSPANAAGPEQPTESPTIPPAQPSPDSSTPVDPTTTWSNWMKSLAVLASIGLIIFVVQWLFAPLGPRQIVERFLEAKTNAESKRYVTERMYPIFNQPDSPTNAGDESVIIGESAVAGKSDEYHIGVRAKFFEPSIGRRMEMECVFQLVPRKGTWAINDIFVLRVDGEPLVRPVSILELNPGLPATSSRSSLGEDAYRQAKNWFDTNPKSKMLGGIWAIKALNSGAFKSIGIGLIAVFAAIAAWNKRRKSP